MPRYRVLVGLNYPPNDQRAEPGDIVDDLEPKAAQALLKKTWLRADGTIGPAIELTTKKPEKKDD